MAVSCPVACRYCGQATPHHRTGLCPECRRERDKRRGTARQRGYDRTWLKLRRKALMRDDFTCRECGWQPPLVAACRDAGIKIPVAEVFEELRRAYNAGETHLAVDHIIPIEQRPDLRLRLDNLQTLCAPGCHGQKTARESFQR